MAVPELIKSALAVLSFDSDSNPSEAAEISTLEVCEATLSVIVADPSVLASFAKVTPIVA